MKIEPNMYVRTLTFSSISRIGKLEKIDDICITNNGAVDKTQIVKASHNIIDLIKPKDIILGNDGKLYQCWKVYKDYVFTYSKNKQGLTITLVDYQIDRVMCYEQFESMSYKVGE